MIHLPRRFLLGSERIIREAATKKTTTVVSNEVLIMLTLFCALICMVGLAMVARCAWYRHSSSTSPEPASQPSSEIIQPDKGVNNTVLQSIPKLIFSPSLLSPPSPLPNGLRMATDCPICLAEFEGGDEIRVLPRCMHVFHLHCVDTWFSSHSSCPFCRQPIGPVAEPPHDGSLCHTCGASTAEGRSRQ